MNIMTQYPQLKETRQWFLDHVEDMLQEDIAICQVPSPSWDEGDRAVYLKDRFTRLGLEEVSIDAALNVIGWYRGTGKGPVIMLAAHHDTVFPRETDLTVTRKDGRLYAPGIRDNSFGVTSMIWLIEALKANNISLPGDLLCVATSGEEGLGDLKGMKEAMKTYHEQVDYVLVIDGALGGITNGGITSRRLEVIVTTGGGHSYGAFGVPSAVHSLGKMIAKIADIQVPKNPKTTYNVGVIEGGTSINTIAARASFLLDMRSQQRPALENVEEQVREIIAEVEKADGVQVEIVLKGDRPGGETSADHPLVVTMQEILQDLGLSTETSASSTDANVAMAYNVPAVCFGCAFGGNAHRTDEWLQIEGIDLGMTLFINSVCAVMGLPKRI